MLGSGETRRRPKLELLSESVAVGERPRRAYPTSKLKAGGLFGAGVAAGVLAFHLLAGGSSDRPVALEPPSRGTRSTASSNGTNVYSATGSLVAERRAVLSANIVGRLVAVLVQPGDKLAKGQIVARLDSRAARAELASAQASLSRAATQILSAEARSKLAYSQLARAEPLIARSFITNARVDELRSAAQTSRQDVSAAQADRVASEMTARSYSVLVDNHLIRAPFAGIVSEVSAQPGEIVSPSSAGGGFIRTGIASLIDPSAFRVEADIPERYITQLHVGSRTLIRTKEQKPRLIEGTVAWISPSADRQRGTVTVGVRLPKETPNLLDGIEVDIDLYMESPK